MPISGIISNGVEILLLSITGLSNSGKTTVFNALTALNIETTIYPSTSGEPHRAVVKVPDSRLKKLTEVFKPKKTVQATIEYIDYIGLTKGDISQNRKVFDLIKDVDAIVHVVRAFRDDSVIHPLKTIDPLRDIETVELELIFGDLELVEKRLDRINEMVKGGKKPDESEKKLLLKCHELLSKEIALRDVEFSEEEKIAMRHLQFLSIKPAIIVLNIAEEDLNKNSSEEFYAGVEDYLRSKNKKSVSLLTLCGKLEMEIAQFPPEEARAFLDDLGIGESALYKLIHTSYKALDLISFFTYSGNEVKAWTVKKGTTSLKAAGKIHSDIERGFIRAEVISFDDFVSSGDLHTAREKGLLRLEGKSYEVKDGDIIHFRFNV